MRNAQYMTNPLWLPQGHDVPLDGPEGRLPSRSSIVWTGLMARRVENKQPGHPRRNNVPSRQFSGL
jgi:hypothetical protein